MRRRRWATRYRRGTAMMIASAIVTTSLLMSPTQAAAPADAVLHWGDTVDWAGGPLTGNGSAGNLIGDTRACLGPACDDFLLDIQVAPSPDPGELRSVQISLEASGPIDLVLFPPGGDPAYDYALYVDIPARVPEPEPGVWRVQARCFDACAESTYTARATTVLARRPTAVAHRAGAIADPNADASGHGEMRQVGSGAWEPSLGIASDGTILYQAYSVDGVPRVMRSIDGGVGWRDASPRRAAVRTHQTSADPYLYLDPDTDRVFTVDLVGCHQVSFSADLGTNWSDSAICGPMDFQKVIAGPAVSSATVGYPNIVYICAIQGGIASPTSTAEVCSKSLDGGITWIPTGTVPFHDDPNGRSGYGVDGHCVGGAPPGGVGPDGTLYLARGWCGTPTIAISKDEGATWERHRISDKGTYRGARSLDEAAIGEDLGVDLLGFWASSEITQSAMTVDEEGTLYFVWVADDRLPYLTTSIDGGLTWREPLMIAPPGVGEASIPDIAVGAPGKIAIAYMGTENSPGAPFPDEVMICDAEAGPFCVGGSGPDVEEAYAATTWNGYITMSDDVLSVDPLFTSAPVNDPADPLVRGTCGWFRCSRAGDFFDIQIGPDGTAWAAFVDLCVEEECTQLVGPGVVGRIVGGPSLR